MLFAFYLRCNIVREASINEAAIIDYGIMESIMRKLFLGAALLSASSLTLANYGASGCGAGSILFDGQEGLAPNVLAGTTNGIFGNQTFGMSTGTLGCGTGAVQANAALYIDSNMDNIASDMSRGEGESLTALAEALGVAEQDQATFAEVTKTNFDKIFSSASVNAEQVIDSLVSVMKQDEALAKYVI